MEGMACISANTVKPGVNNAEATALAGVELPLQTADLWGCRESDPQRSNINGLAYGYNINFKSMDIPFNSYCGG